MKKTYSLEINLPQATSEAITQEELVELKDYLNRYICETFDICNADIKIITKITN